MSTSSLSPFLPHGTRLSRDKFAIGPLMAQERSVIRYKGGDMEARRYVVIHEFFPPGAVRQGREVVDSSLSSEEFERRKVAFAGEARALVQLAHDSVARVYDVFEENDTVYMVTEFLEGETLAKRIETKKQLDETEVLDIGVRLSATLSVLHEAGILHRDINPENVLLCGTRPVLVNFGIDLASQPRRQFGATGHAPAEQYSTEARQSPATDVYGLAATLYHALTGHAPVSASERYFGAVLPAPTALRSHLTPYLEKALVAALQLDPDERLSSAADFGAMLKGHSLRHVATTALYRSEQFLEKERSPEAPVQTESLNFTSTLKNHNSYVNALAFSPLTTHLVSVGQDRLVIVWNWVSGAIARRLAIHEGAVNSVAFSPDGNWFVTAGKDQKILVWPTGEKLKGEPENSDLHTQGEVFGLAFHPLRRALAWTDETSLKMWDWDAPPPNVVVDAGIATGAFSFSPDGSSIIAAAKRAGLLYRFDGNSLKLQSEFMAHKNDVTGLAYSPDGRSIATCGLDGYVCCFDSQSGQLKWKQKEQFDNLHSLAWSPDGEFIAIGKREAVSLWTSAGEHWRQFKRHEKPVRAVAFSSNCPAPFKYVLATGSQDRTIVVHRIKRE